MPAINTFIYLDLEATGLNGIGEKPNITELSMVAVHRSAILNSRPQPPRVMDKITLCIYPMKPISPTAAEMSGLYNDNLLHKKDFDENLAQSIRLFIERQESPVCLMAHYGLGFDYPLLKAQLSSIGHSLPDDVFCVDTLPMMKQLDENERKREELRQQNQETPSVPPIVIGQHSASLRFQVGAIPEEQLKSVKRKLFMNDTPEKKTKSDGLVSSDVNDNTVNQSVELCVAQVEENTSSASDSKSTGLVSLQENISLPDVELSLQSQESSASTIICGEFPSNPSTQSQKLESLESVIYTSEEGSTSEETTPAKQSSVPSLIQKLACTETITSEDSGSDMELGKIVLQKAESTLWGSIPDDVLLSVDLESNSASSKESHSTEKKTISCPESTKPQESSMNQTLAPTSRLETCRRNLQFAVAEQVERNNRHILPHRQPLLPSKPHVSYKLGDIYQRLFGVPPRKAHSAEDDCITLLAICQKKGKRMLEWCEENATLFKDVPVMYEVSRTPLKTGVFPHHV